MNSNLTEVVVILDRSGSMASCHEETERGLNSFIAEQKTIPGDVNFSLYTFNGTVSRQCYREPIRNTKKFSFEPTGGTALYDAIGQAIDEIGNSLNNEPEGNRPSMVTVMILTDGEENSSNIYNRQQIKEMIERQQNVYSWNFTFFGANQDAVLKGTELGVSKMSAVTYCTGKVEDVLRTYSDKMSGCRIAGSSAGLNYTDTEKADLV